MTIAIINLRVKAKPSQPSVSCSKGAAREPVTRGRAKPQLGARGTSRHV